MGHTYADREHVLGSSVLHSISPPSDRCFPDITPDFFSVVMKCLVLHLKKLSKSYNFFYLFSIRVTLYTGISYVILASVHYPSDDLSQNIYVWCRTQFCGYTAYSIIFLHSSCIASSSVGLKGERTCCHVVYGDTCTV